MYVPHVIEQNASAEGRSAKLTALRGLFSASTCHSLNFLPLNDLSYVGILKSLGSASPVVWSNLVRQSPWLNSLTPRDLDNWPLHEVDIRAYLKLIDEVWYSGLVQSGSVLQNPVDFCSTLHPIFKDLGWYDIHHEALRAFQQSVPPAFNDTVHNEDDGDLIGDSPPPDKDAVWEPAVYPTEWPPLPAPTWTATLKAATAEWNVKEAEWRAEEAEVEADWAERWAREAKAKAEEEREAWERKARDAAELKAFLAEIRAAGRVAGEAERETERAEVEGGFGSRIRKLVCAKLRGGVERAGDTDVERQ